MGIWKQPEEVTNEKCKVKCPVKSSGDLKQATITASGRFRQTVPARPALRSEWLQVSVAGLLLYIDVAGVSGAGKIDPHRDTGPPSRHDTPPHLHWAAIAVLSHPKQVFQQLQWLNVGCQSAGSLSKPLWIKWMQTGVPLQLGLRWHLLLPFN